MDAAQLAEVFYQGLAASNQDFREVRRMFSASALEVRTHPFGTVSFQGADIRLKQQYIGRR